MSKKIELNLKKIVNSKYIVNDNINDLELFKIMEELSRNYNADLVGDPKAGTMNFKIPVIGKISLTYTITNNVLIINILKKPFLLNYSAIESKIIETLSNL